MNKAPFPTDTINSAAAEPENRLFSYGSLQQPKVQLANFGRLLEGRPDTLRGYSMSAFEICDPKVIAISGTSQHTIIRFSGDPNDAVTGTLFRVTSEELARADLYEVAAYRRVAVQLCSGRNAFVYVASGP